VFRKMGVLEEELADGEEAVHDGPPDGRRRTARTGSCESSESAKSASQRVGGGRRCGARMKYLTEFRDGEVAPALWRARSHV